MDRMLTIYIDKYSEDEVFVDKSSEESARILLEYLARLGIKIETSPCDFMQNHIQVSFRFDDVEVNRYLSRGAGRKNIFLMQCYKDILEMRKTMTDKQIIEHLGLSRATYYRLLKKHANDLPPYDDFF